LDALRDKLIRLTPVGSGAGIDLAAGQVVLHLAGEASSPLATQLSYHRGRVRVERIAPIEDLEYLYGGQGIEAKVGSEKCSTGFNATSGQANIIITAGHCTMTSERWERKNMYLGERYMHSVYGPQGDYGVIEEKGVNFTPRPAVNTDVVGVIAIMQVAEPYVGQELCKMGNTSKFTCGTVLEVNYSVQKTDFVMEGMIRTDICAEPGDSGGPLMTPYRFGPTVYAYGVGIVANGGVRKGECARGVPSITHFQPLQEILDWYGLTLGITS
jgi:hypothetical protein